MKKKTLGVVRTHTMIAPGIYDLWIKTELATKAMAGQFVGVYTKDKSKILPRPISICEVSDDRTSLRLVYRVSGQGTGTELISMYQKGDSVELLGVLGNGYSLEKIFGKDILLEMKNPFLKEEAIGKVVLLGGGIGIPPMLELAKELKAHDIACTVIAGYRDSNLFLKEDFEKYSEFIVATEDGSVGTKGNVLDALKNEGIVPKTVMACGPMPMLRAIKAYTEEMRQSGHQVKAYISLEERMACGVGACLGCVTKTSHKDEHSQVNNARICTDGPVFDADDVLI